MVKPETEEEAQLRQAIQESREKKKADAAKKEQDEPKGMDAADVPATAKGKKDASRPSTGGGSELTI